MPHPIRSLIRHARVRRRRGSVLILVVALVVLLALIGTAYLSSTQTERYTATQHIYNTQADLQLQGLVLALNGTVTNGLASAPFGSANPRQAPQDMPTYDGQGTYTVDTTRKVKVISSTTLSPGQAAFDPPTSYNQFTGPQSDLFLGNRVPTLDGSIISVMPAATAGYGWTKSGWATWGSVAWSPFPNAAGEYEIVSPLDIKTSTPTFVARLPGAYKPYVQCYPTSKAGSDGVVHPGVVLYLSKVPDGYASSLVYPTSTGYLTPTGFKPGVLTAAGLTSAANICFAPNVSGDGIADGVFFPMPGGPVAGVTYYGALRVVDGNSAVNASTAYASVNDYSVADGSTAMTNYGFFRSNMGLRELLNNAAALTEVQNLDKLRFGNAFAGGIATHKFSPIDDAPTALPPGRTDFAFYSVGDAMESQLARRTGNPGYMCLDANSKVQMAGFGPAETASLAYHFGVQNQSLGVSPFETCFAQDLTRTGTNQVPVTAYSVNALAEWFGGQFDFSPTVVGATNPLTNNMPLRTLMVGNNGVSNGVPSRFGNLQAPPKWSATTGTPAAPTVYKFGDWVTDNGRSYVCIQSHTVTAALVGTEPGLTGGVNPAATPYWAGTQLNAVPGVQPGLPFTRQPTKVAINTAPFDQLWLGFCQVMCDSIGSDPPLAGGPPTATAPKAQWQWQPPMRPQVVTAPTEQQMPMFRNVVRYPQVTDTALRLSASQMLKLRAAIAAVNTMDIRDSDDDVTSRRIILTDATGNPEYDAEVFGSEAQPFIGAVYAHLDTAAPTNDFLTVQLVNPYDHAIKIDPTATGGWKLGVVNRTNMTAANPNLTMTDVTASVGLTQAFVVPAKDPTTGRPGIAILQSGTPPTGYTPPAVTATLTPPAGSTTVIEVTNLALVLSGTNRGELYLMKPRVQKSTNTTPIIASSSPSSRTTTVQMAEAYDETSGGNIADLVPVDQVDLTNLEALAAAQAGQIGDFHYRRGSDEYGGGTASPGLAGWHFVYPGPSIPPTTAIPYASQLPQGFGTTINVSPATFPPVMTQTYGYQGTTVPDYTGVNNAARPTFLSFPIVVNNTNMGGPNRLTQGVGTLSGYVPSTVTPPQFPFGGFARNVDMMQIPFIGAYRIRAITATGAPFLANSFRAMNSVSEDASLAEDVLDPVATYGTGAINTVPPTPSPNDSATSTTTNKTNATDAPKPKPSDVSNSQLAEQIGRFCPVGDPNTTAANPATFDFLETGDAYMHWHYHWGKRLFDYFTVQTPASDFFPDVDPTPMDPNITVTGGVPDKYDPVRAPTATSAVPNTSPTVSNANTAGTSEDTTGTEGLVNINTAPWPVLAALPLFAAGTDNIGYTPTSGTTLGTAATGSNSTDDRIDIAKAIVDDRNQNGPFKSIADLYRVQAFRLANDAIIAPAGTYGEVFAAQGVFAPNGFGAGAPVTPSGRPRYDFQDRFLLLNRISNLITTRSDTFTCYVTVQGYRDIGVPGATPTMVVQRRAAYLLDRNGVTPSSPDPVRYVVPNN